MAIHPPQANGTMFGGPKPLLDGKANRGGLANHGPSHLAVVWGSGSQHGKNLHTLFKGKWCFGTHAIPFPIWLWVPIWVGGMANAPNC